MPSSARRLLRSAGLLDQCRRRRNRGGGPPRLSCELLESRRLLSAPAFGSPLSPIAPNETIDQALDLRGLEEPAQVFGSIGNGPDAAADVAWYQFELNDASQVRLEVNTPAGDSPFASVLSLFNNDPNDFGDPYDADGHRLLTQVTADPTQGALAFSQNLAPGEYFVAISGAGNLDFSPVIAGSGFDGATGNYELRLSATDLGLSNDGPAVVASDPAPGAVLASSPLAIRLEMSGALDPITIVAGEDVQLDFSSEGAGGASTPVPLASVNFSTAADELQLFPLGPLAPGYYTIELTGSSSGGAAVLASPSGVPLGEDSATPAGANESVAFQVDGIDGVVDAAGSDDTAATAQQLGDMAGAGLVQVNGAIGIDPFFSPGASSDPSSSASQSEPANQADLYHFEITGPGNYAMVAEVFAGRIGSPLQPGVSLYEVDPTSGQLVLVAGNIGSLNPTQGTDSLDPLLSDPVLSAALVAGDYYLAVADASNTASPSQEQPPGSPGIFDPNQPGSAQNGWSTGQYVLNLLVQSEPVAPQVVTSSPSSGQILDAVPTEVTVQFSQPMNITQLALEAYETNYQTTVRQVFIESNNGEIYYPRFVSYDDATNVATFQMLDGLPNGGYSLHLSGWAGLTDLGGVSLEGNSPSGDDVIPFEVDGPISDISGNMEDGYTVVGQAGNGIPQDVGTLFPDELQAGVTIIRGPGTAQDSTEDEYVIQVTQSQQYSFTLEGSDLPAMAQVTLTDAQGQPVPLLSDFTGQAYFAPLTAGTYTIAVGGWTAGQSASVAYELTMYLVGQQDNAPPLVTGPTPLIQIVLDNAGSSTQGATNTVSVVGGGASSQGALNTDPAAGAGAPAGSQPTAIVFLMPSSSSAAPIEFAGALASLSVGPLGSAGGDSLATATAPVQVALGPAEPTAGYGGLVSLLTSLYVLPWHEEGETTDSTDLASEQRATTSVAMAGVSASQSVDAPVINPADTLILDEAPLAPVKVALVPASGPFTAEVLSAPIPSGSIPRADGPVHAAFVNDWSGATAVDRELLMRLAFAGTIVAATLAGRRAVRELKWRKEAAADRPPAARLFYRRRSDRNTTAIWTGDPSIPSVRGTGACGGVPAPVGRSRY
jgi:methionine-rich copper-binding protein CopC